MAGKSTKAFQIILALILGSTATAFVLAVHIMDWDSPAELLTLDFRFRHFSNTPANPKIVNIDIDDRSLEEIERWPWPRAKLAGIIQTLAQAGAESIALDIILPEPQNVRYVSDSTDLYSADTGKLLTDAGPQPVFDDMLLRQAIEKFGRVAIPMHVNPLPPVKNSLEIKVQEFVRNNPRVDFPAVRRQILPDLPENQRDERLDIVRREYLAARSLAGLRRFALNSKDITGFPAEAGQITPPLVTLAEACNSSGFVTFDPDNDGVVRRIPMLAGDDESIYPQFALALAANQLSGEHGPGKITADESKVTIAFQDGFRRIIPIDASGMMLINWMPGQISSDRTMHISAAKIAGVQEMSQAIEENTVRKRLMLMTLASMGRAFPTPELENAYWKIVELDKELNAAYQRRLEKQFQREQALLFWPAEVPPGSDELHIQETQIEAQIDKLLGEFHRQLDDPSKLQAFLGGPAESENQLEEADDLLNRIGLAEKANRNLKRELRGQETELHTMIEGKLCIVGSIATGAADFVPTPVQKRTPGVWVHSNILNTIVSGAFIRKVEPNVAAITIIAAGLTVTLLATFRPILTAAPATLLFAGAFGCFNVFIVFARLNFWMPMVAPLGAMFAALFIVTAFRQLTEERAKRQIRAMFAHALSPALVDKLIEDPSLAKLGGERRELTFFFSDLAGFTTLAERLGESGTIKILNRYFDRMTEVIQNQRGGYLNKFLGDGLFVFFGAPVFQEDHAARAIAAAVDCQAELKRFNSTLSGEFDGDVELHCRIGISTGQVMVGNCGSTQRMDYTAIGDPVNLASRLESAGKIFGVNLLVADESWQAGRDDSLLARPLGQVTVIGKIEPVKIWHVLSPIDQAGEKTKKAFRDFTKAVELIQQNKFNDAAELFKSVKKELGEDKPSDIYLDICHKYSDWPTGQPWDGIIHLTEK